MTQFIYQDQTPTRRLEMLAKNALRNEVANYSRTLSEDEVNAERHAYTQLSINLSKIEEEKKEAMGVYAGKIKALKAVMTAGLNIIKNGKREVEGKLFYFADQIGGKMNAYDKNGELITSRNLSPSEVNMQLYIGDNTDQINQGLQNDHETEDATHTEVPPVKETLAEAKKRKKQGIIDAQAAIDKKKDPAPEVNIEQLSETVKAPKLTKKEKALANALIPESGDTADTDGSNATIKKMEQMTKNRKESKAKIDQESNEASTVEPLNISFDTNDTVDIDAPEYDPGDGLPE